MIPASVHWLGDGGRGTGEAGGEMGRGGGMGDGSTADVGAGSTSRRAAKGTVNDSGGGEAQARIKSECAEFGEACCHDRMGLEDGVD